MMMQKDVLLLTVLLSAVGAAVVIGSIVRSKEANLLSQRYAWKDTPRAFLVVAAINVVAVVGAFLLILSLYLDF